MSFNLRSGRGQARVCFRAALTSRRGKLGDLFPDFAMPTRAELDQWLDALQDRLPDLKMDEDADFDFLAFRQESERIQDCAEGSDAEHVRVRIQSMLEQAGLIPSDREAESRR